MKRIESPKLQNTEEDKPQFKEIREKSGMTLKQFSDYFNIPYRTIQDWEHGKRKAPNYVLDLIKYKLDREQNA